MAKETMASCSDSSESVVFVSSPSESVDDAIDDWESVGVSADNDSSRGEESHDGVPSMSPNESSESFPDEETTDRTGMHTSSDHSSGSDWLLLSDSNDSPGTGTTCPPQGVDYASVESRIIQRLIQEDVVLASDLYAQSREDLTVQAKMEIAVYVYHALDHEVIESLFPGLQAPSKVNAEEPPTRARNRPPIWQGSRFVDELPQDGWLESGVTTAVHNGASNAPDASLNRASNSNTSPYSPILYHDGFCMIAKDLDPTGIQTIDVTEMVNKFARDTTHPALLAYLEGCGIVKPDFEIRHTHPTQLKSFISTVASMSTVFSVAVLFQTFERDYAIGRLIGFHPMDGDSERLCKDPRDCMRDDHSAFRMLAYLVIVSSPTETSPTHVVSSSNQLPIGVIQWNRDNTLKLPWETQRNQEAKAKSLIIQRLIQQDISWASETYLQYRLELTRKSKQEIGEYAIRLVDKEVLDCLFPWLFKMDELQELKDRKEQGKEVDEVRLHDLQLLERRNNGERLSEDEIEYLESMQQQRDKEVDEDRLDELQVLERTQELNALCSRHDQGLEVDETRLYELELWNRQRMGETLTEVELEDLRYFAAERDMASASGSGI